MNEPATLELGGVVVRRAGTNLCSPLSLRSDARRLGLVGDPTPLLDALTGNAQITAGTAHVLGCELSRALAQGVVGLSVCDPLLPESFTVAEYLAHAARLSHGQPRRAALETQRALQRFGLAELSARKLPALELYQRRALSIALATLSTPALVWLEAPLSGLDAPSAEYLRRLCDEAARDACLVVTSAWPTVTSVERALLESCDELLLLQRGELLTQGAPSQLFAATGRYSLTLAGPALPAFCQTLANAGCRLTERAEGRRWTLELPAGASTDLVLDLALDHQVDVLELDPILGS